MADDIDEVVYVDTKIAALAGGATSSDIYRAVAGDPSNAVGAAAIHLAMAGGEGGEGLPEWWTVDSTPDAESVEFGGSVQVDRTLNIQDGVTIAATSPAEPLHISDIEHGGDLFNVLHEGSQLNVPLRVQGTDWSSDPLLIVANTDGDELLHVAVDGLGFFDAEPVAQPEIPASPNAQDIADVLVALGLCTQAA